MASATPCLPRDRVACLPAPAHNGRRWASCIERRAAAGGARWWWPRRQRSRRSSSAPAEKPLARARAWSALRPWRRCVRARYCTTQWGQNLLQHNKKDGAIRVVWLEATGTVLLTHPDRNTQKKRTHARQRRTTQSNARKASNTKATSDTCTAYLQAATWWYEFARPPCLRDRQREIRRQTRPESPRFLQL